MHICIFGNLNAVVFNKNSLICGIMVEYPKSVEKKDTSEESVNCLGYLF